MSAFGSAFGQPAGSGALSVPASSSSFTFGAPAPQSTGFSFGAPAASTGSTGLNFGVPAPQNTGINFGAPATQSTGLNFGAPATQSTGLNFGAPATQSSGFSFGAPAAPTGSTGLGFGAPAASTGGFGGFGVTSSSAPSFGSFAGFGAKPITSTAPSFGGLNFGGGGGLGTSTGGFSFGNTQQQQQQPHQQQQQQGSLYSSLLNVAIYGDERDAILARWNQLQARWGVGKGYYSAGSSGVEFTADNAFCLMKTVGYARLPTTEDKDGLVALCFTKTEEELKTGQQSVIECVGRLLGSRPNLSVCVDCVQATAINKSELHIYVQERNQNGTVRRVPASDLLGHLQAPVQRSQLTSVAVTDLYSVTRPSSHQLTLYLENPPAGIDAMIWEQAKKDNPDPDTMVPVPVVGFQELHRKIQRQVEENDGHQKRLDLIADSIANLQRCQATSSARLAHLKRQHTLLTHRLIKVLVRQEVTRKLGWSIQPDEEALRVQLEALQSELSAPTQFKGRLNELLSRARLQWQEKSGAVPADRCRLQADRLAEVQQLLHSEQLGLQQLVQLVRTDMEDLQLLTRHLTDSTSTDDIA